MKRVGTAKNWNTLLSASCFHGCDTLIVMHRLENMSTRVALSIAFAASTFLFVPAFASAGNFFCVTSTTPLVVNSIDSSQWNANGCYNAGPNGEATKMPGIGLGLDSAANAMCTPVDTRCPCNFVMTKFGCKAGKNKYFCQPAPDVCYAMDTSGKFQVLGTCVAPYKCQGMIAPGLNGGNVLDSALSQLGQAVGQMLQQLMQGSAGGSGSSGDTSQYPGACPNGYYQVSAPSSDPCAQYVPLTSSSIDTSLPNSSGADALLQALQGGSASDQGSGPTITITNSNTNTNENTNATSISALTSTTTGVTLSGTGIPVLLAPISGMTGDIQYTDSGATVVAGSMDAQSNTTVAGFYGSDTFGGQPQGIAAKLCQGRPWASNFLSVLITPAFFDNLCTWRGYQVGAPPPVSTPVLQQTPIQHQAATSSAPAVTTPSVPPKVDIWAVPASVPLATRTTIYWSTQGVTDCDVFSSDGNFNQSSLSGGAATVPLTGATMFTISCSAPNGSPVTDSVTVNLAI